MNRWQMTLVWARLLCVLLLSGAAVGQAPFTTTTTIAASGSTGNYTLTGTVAGPGTSTVYPTGSLSFLDTTLGGNSLGSATLGAPVYSQVLTQKASLGDGLAEKIADNEVVAGDFNGDGKMDLALANSGGVVEIFLGNGDGTFGAETKIVLPSINGTDNSNTLPRIASGDFNGDGKLDLVVTCATTDVWILLGNGNGTFQTATEAMAGASGYPMGLIAADFNGDGKLDIVLAMSGNYIYFAPGTGTGTFGTVTHRTTATTYLAGIVSGDFNGDGHRDLIVLDGETSSGSIVGGTAWMYLGNGDGTFATGTSLGGGGIRAAVGDFKGDGELDVAFISGSSANVTVYLGNGAGGFTPPSSQPSSVGSYNFGDVVLGDFNGDGKLDIVCVAQAGTSTEIVLYLGTGTGTFVGTSYSLAGNGPTAIASADLNGDGTPDLVIPNYSVSTTSIVLDSVTATVTATLTGVNPKGGGTHNVEASFPAETKYKASTSGTVALTGTAIATTLSLSPNPTSSNYGQQVALTAILNPYSYETLTTNGEAISFYGNGTFLGTANLSSGVATYQTTSLPSGTDSLTASFATDGNFAASGASSSITVSRITPTITWATPAAITYGTALSSTQLNASSGGVAGTFTYTPASGTILGAGTQTLSVTFTPSNTTTYASASATVSLVVNKAATTISISSTLNPTIVGQNVSWPFTLGTAYGTIPSGDGISYYANGADDFNTTVGGPPWGGTGLGVGTYSIYAIFAGDANYLSSTSNTVNQVVKAAPALSVSCSPNPITYGSQTANCTSSLTGGSSPTGTITWTINGGAWTTTAINGTAGGFAGYAAGTYTIAVSYAGDANNASASGSTVLTINRATVTATASLSANTMVYGSTPVTAGVQVSCNSACGNVDYRYDGGEWGAVALSSSGSYSAQRPSNDSAGTHTVQINYLGNANYSAVNSNSVTFTVTKATPVISWSNPAAITYGTALSSTQLNASSGGVAGTFTYSPALGAILNAGTQTLSVTFTPSDATDYNLATGTVSLVVNKATTTISISSTLNPTTYGQTVSWPFTLSTASGTIPSGDQIVYYANSAAQFNTTVGGPAWGGYGLNAGTFNIYAAFQGDANYLPSSSNTVSQVVNKATPTVYFTTDSPVTYGTPLIVDVYVSCGNACGSVDYLWDGSEWGTVPLDSTGDYAASRSPSDAAGTHTVQVNYLGDANHNAVNTTAQTITINKAPTVAELTSSVNPLVAGATTTLSTLVDTGGAEPPTGTVTWTTNGTTVGVSSVSTVTTTNLVQNSNNLTSATWNGHCGPLANFTPNTTDVAGPDGTNTATKLVTSGGDCAGPNSSGLYTTIPAGLTAGQGYVVSIWMRGAVGGEYVTLGLNDCLGGGIALTTSWVRYSFAYPTLGSGVSGCADGARGFQVIVPEAASVYLWGAQTEAATALGPYVATGNASATGSGGLAQLATSSLMGGRDVIVATYSGDSNDRASTSPTVTELVNKATPPITWATPAAITYGTALSTTQLNASSGGIAGTFAYTPAAGSFLPVGNQTLSVTFTPTDTTDYSTVSKSVSLVVNMATPTVVLTAASTEVYGTPNTATVHVSCNSACGAVDYRFDGADWGTVLLDSTGNSSATRPSSDTVGNHTIQVQYSGDSYDNAGTSNLVSYTITKATPTITWATPAAITYGTALSATQLNASSGTAGSFVYTPAAGAILTAGTQTLSVTFTPIDTTDYNTANATVSLVVKKASPTITLSAASTEVYGTPNTASVHVSCNTSCGSVDYKFDGGEWSTVALDSSGNFVATRPTSIDPVGTHTIQVLYLGDANDNPATSNTVTYTVTKATPAITWATPAAITYGTALSATQLNASSGGVAGSFVYSPTAGAILNAGTQTLSVTFTPTDTADYNTATGTVSLVVNKAKPTITLTLSSTTPTFGDTISATISVNCGNSCGAGSYIIDSSNTGNVPLSSGGTYIAGINFSSVGSHTVQAQVVGNSNYNSALTAVQAVTVAKATPTISWANPAAITYGTALSSTQLNASSGTAGSFVYTPAAGTVLNAGTQTLSVTFIPTDTTDYNSTTVTRSVAVSKASPTITWAPPTAITYGTPLSSTQLNASLGGLAGTFVYTPAAGTVLGSGIQTLSVTFTPTDTNDYSTGTVTVSLTVNRAIPIITWTTPSAITYGTPLSSTQLNASSATSGTFAYSPISGTVLATGIQTLSVTFTPTDTTDYGQTTAAVPLTVTKSATVISVTATPNPAIYGDQIEFKFVFSGTGVVPTGQATVADGVNTLGTITIDGSGVATYRTSDLTAGSHVLTATYMGDADYQ